MKKIIIIIIGILITILLIVFIIALVGMYKFNYLANKDGYDVDGNKITVVDFESCVQAGHLILETYPEQCFDGKNNFIREINLEQKNENKHAKPVMILFIPELIFEMEQEKFVIKFSEYEVPKSPQILTETYLKLFDLRGNLNNLGVWNGLSFNSVSIENNKLAILKLEGSWFPIGGMSSLYFKREIEAVAFQHENVESIKVLVNNKIFDWCIDSQADYNESHCDTIPRLWVQNKDYFSYETK